MKALVGGSDDCILSFTMIGSEAGEVIAAVQTAILAELPYGRLRDHSFQMCRPGSYKELRDWRKKRIFNSKHLRA
jgi:pyruvate/2-oxoglutarate dehydrogenase complex dihydrolipoamide dehydrogenase (E3) component